MFTPKGISPVINSDFRAYSKAKEFKAAITACNTLT